MTQSTSDSNLYDSTRRAWERIWDDASVEIELQTAQYRRAKKQQAAFLPYLNQDDLILEAGSGLSAMVITLRQQGYNVIGMDYAENALHTSRAHTPDLPLLAGDVHHLPFQDNSLGGYLSFGVLEHFEHGMGAALSEAYRVLKPGGVAVVTIPYPNLVWKLAQWRRQQQGKERIDDDFYESTYTRDELITELTSVGFDVICAEPTGHSFTFWGLGGVFQDDGYYRTSTLAEACGDVAEIAAPWWFNFMTLIVGRK